MKISLPLPLLALMAVAPSSFGFSPVSRFPSTSTSTPTSILRSSTLVSDSPAPLFRDDGEDKGNDRREFSKRKTPPSTTSTSHQPSSSKRKGAISMQIKELTEALGGKGRAKIAWDCYSIGIDPVDLFGPVIRLGMDDFESIHSLMPTMRRSQKLGPEAIERLRHLYKDYDGKIEGGVATLAHVSRATDKTTKLLLKLADGLQVETVIIPWKDQRSTLCISSQVGCKQGCKFCATGKMGKLRDLTSDEILAQMFFAKKICRLEGLPDVSNIVFMGMGEPADNADNVNTAVEILTARELYSLSASKVTVSTVAPTPDAFRNFAKSSCQIAWSVHAANDKLRKDLVPTTKYSMAELREGLIDALNARPHNFRATMLEIALMADVNDTDEAADELAEFSKVILDRVENCKLILNLIPYNPIDGYDRFQKPTPERVVEFQRRLQGYNLFTHVRATRGDDKTAACGQLATQKSKKMP